MTDGDAPRRSPPAGELDSLEEITHRLRAFRDERNWAAFHTPKNLAVSIAIETGELLEHFQWRSDDEICEHIRDARDEVASELADVAIYVLQLADVTAISLGDAIAAKLRGNAERYPAHLSRDSHAKYDRLREE